MWLHQLLIIWQEIQVEDAFFIITVGQNVAIERLLNIIYYNVLPLASRVSLTTSGVSLGRVEGLFNSRACN